MKTFSPKKIFSMLFASLIFLYLSSTQWALSEDKKDSSLKALLPEVNSWKLSEAPETYLPDTLFEYINGAAEIYLLYDFAELIVAQYENEDSAASLTVEIYDMGNEKNSFGIYGAERFHDANFLSIGNGGYVEEGILNFLVGKYYIKLFCFDCDAGSEEILKRFSQEVVEKVRDKRHLPTVLGFFPEEGLVRNSEKFILRNFMGYSFLGNGYLANYKHEKLEFDCFFIEGEDSEDAQRMLKQFLETRDEQSVEKIPLGYRLKDNYYHNVYLARIENYICGLMKIKDEFEEVGKKYLEMLIKSAKESQKSGELKDR